MSLLKRRPDQSIQTFSFLKYVHPIWYYTLIPASDALFGTPFYDGSLSDTPEGLSIDEAYEGELAVRMDLGYQAWHSGLLLETTRARLLPFLELPAPSIADNYRFLRKFFPSRWCRFAFLLRLITLHNPFAEWKAFRLAGDAPFVRGALTPKRYSDYEGYSAVLVNRKTPVTVIIPTLNRYTYLERVLKDLEKQTVPPAEVVITDQTDEPNREFYESFRDSLNLKVIFQEEKGQWLGRNAAIREASTDFLLFFDDDSSVEPNWIEEHLKGMEFFNADIVAGVSISKVGDRVPRNYSYFRWADQFDSGNALVKRRVFEKVGMFDRQYDKMRMGDGEFGLRAYLHGFRGISHPRAKRLHYKVSSGGLRQMGSWDGFRPKKWFAPRPVPSVVFLFRTYFPKSYAVWGTILGVLPSLVPYKYKGNRVLKGVGIFTSLLLWPVLLAQILRSWGVASRMLAEGPKIPSMEEGAETNG